jgi:hypothetical protein
VDYRIDCAELIYVRGDVACLLEVGEVADDRRRPAGDQSCIVSRRSLLRAWTITSWPPSSTDSAASRSMPAAEPVMRTRAKSGQVLGEELVELVERDQIGLVVQVYVAGVRDEILDAATIAYTGAAGETPPHAAGDSLISAPVVLLGLWDCHGHFAGVSTFDWRPWVTDPPALRGAQCAHDLRAALAAGVTSVREVGGLEVYLAQVVDEGAARRSRDLRRRGGPDHDRRPRRRPRGG